MELKKRKHCVYSIEYHIVWCTKYRRKILKPCVEKRLHELLKIYAQNNALEILAINGDLDHIHILVSATPNAKIPNMVKNMKGSTARILIKEFPEIKSQLWGGHVWSPSYFVSTVSENTESNIKKYIESQKKSKM